MFSAITNIVGSFVNPIINLFSKRIPDATVTNIDQTAEAIATTAAQAKAVTEGAMNVRADLQGDRLQRDWRATLMYLLIFILANNTIGVTYLHAREIVMTPEMWNLLIWGAGGFAAFQHIENVVRIFKR